MYDDKFHDLVIARAQLHVALMEVLRAARKCLEAGASSEDVDSRVSACGALSGRVLASWWPFEG